MGTMLISRIVAAIARTAKGYSIKNAGWGKTPSPKIQMGGGGPRED